MEGMEGLYLEKYMFVKEVIDEWDPIGLLSLGCPDDEYDPEIKDIVKLVSQIKSIDEIAVGIQEVFNKWFGENINIEKCNPVAIKIWNKLS
jgi:hypothetical protein